MPEITDHTPPDPTHGRIDRDIQAAVDDWGPTSLGQRVAVENTLQAQRDAGREPLTQPDAVPDSPAILGRARKLIRERLAADPDIGHQHGFVDLLADVAARAVAPLLMSPAAGRVLDAAQDMAAAGRAGLHVEEAWSVRHAYGVLVAAVDALSDRGEGMNPVNPSPPAAVEVLEDALCRRVWAAALRWLSGQIGRQSDASDWVAELADQIESGDLTPWDGTERWDGTVAPGGWVCTVCGKPTESEPCPEHGTQPAAGTPGDGPGWMREDVEAFAANLSRAPGEDPSPWNPEMGDQLRALLAHFDRMNDLVDRQLKQSEAYVRRAEDRAEKAEDERDRLLEAVAKATTERYAARAELAETNTSHDRLAQRNTELVAERDRLRAELAEENEHIVDAINVLNATKPPSGPLGGADRGGAGHRPPGRRRRRAGGGRKRRQCPAGVGRSGVHCPRTTRPGRDHSRRHPPHPRRPGAGPDRGVAVIKAAGEIGGRPFMLLGLSGENVARLAAGEPIAFDGDQLGYHGKVIVVYGKTEADIKAQLQAHGLVPPEGAS